MTVGELIMFLAQALNSISTNSVIFSETSNYLDNLVC